MGISTECTIAPPLAAALREAREDLVRRWLDRIAERVTLNPNHVFPTDELLDHVPLLIDGIADYLEDPADEITADASVIAKAMELGELRHQQGFDAHQLLKEYEILGGILFEFLTRAVKDIDNPCDPSELLVCAHRLFRSVAVIEQTTATHFLRVANDKVKERLHGFNRTVSHELKNRIGAIRGANAMLQEEWIGGDPGQRGKLTGIIGRNTDGMQALLKDLIELSRLESGDGTGTQRHATGGRLGSCAPAPRICRSTRRGDPALGRSPGGGGPRRGGGGGARGPSSHRTREARSAWRFPARSPKRRPAERHGARV